MAQIRVIKVDINDFAADETKRVTESVEWEGDDIRVLSEKYPPSDVFGADPFDQHQIEDGWLRWSFRFEKFEGDTWVKCEDPRVRLNPGRTELEMEIDAENRRLFPGDYLQDDDYYDPDHNERDYDNPDIGARPDPSGDPCLCDTSPHKYNPACRVHSYAYDHVVVCDGLTQAQIDESLMYEEMCLEIEAEEPQGIEDEDPYGLEFCQCNELTRDFDPDCHIHRYLVDRLLVEKWEELTTVKWRSPTDEEHREIRDIENAFGGRRRLFECRAHLAAKK
jgi:hypothetical protein